MSYGFFVEMVRLSLPRYAVENGWYMCCVPRDRANDTTASLARTVMTKVLRSDSVSYTRNRGSTPATTLYLNH